MPFGKHKGQPLASIPHDYLRWVLGNCFLSCQLTVQIQTVLTGKQKRPKPAKQDASSYSPDRYASYEGQPGEIESRLTEADIPY